MNFSESIPATQNQGAVEHWLAEIRKRMPEGSFVTATVQMKPHRGFLASFRLRTDEETLSSEARADSPDEAVDRAGRGLCDHLPALSGISGFDTAAEEEIPRAG